MTFICPIQEQIFEVVKEDVSIWRWNEMDERSLRFYDEIEEEWKLKHDEVELLRMFTENSVDTAAKVVYESNDVECLLSPIEWIRECKRFQLRLRNGSMENDE